MGTFEFRPFAVFNKVEGTFHFGTNIPSQCAASNANLLLAASLDSTRFVEDMCDSGVPDSGSGTLIFTGKFYLDGSGTPLGFNDLPAGFNVTAATFSIKSNGNWTAFNSTYTYFFTYLGFENSPILPANSTYSIVISPTPSAFEIDSFIGYRFIKSGSSGTNAWNAVKISGTYIIAATQWYYSPSLDVYNSTGGGDFAPVSTPTVTVTGVFPNQGTTAGGIATVIEGSGFSQAATATIVGVNVTGVTVIDQHSMHCTTGAYGGALGAATPFTIGGEDPTHAGAVVSAKLAVGDVVVTDN